MKTAIKANDISSLAINSQDNLFKLEEELQALKELSNKRHVRLLTHTDESLLAFMDMDEEKQNEILKSLSTYMRIMSRVEALEVDKEEMDFDDEVECLQSALEEFGMKLGDDDTNFIDEGDIVELYSLDNIQLYRNFQFLRVNPYDLLTILSTDWPKLYERPKTITQAITEKVGDVLNSERTSAVFFDIPTHTMKACAKHDQVLVEINLKYIKPIYSKRTGEKAGFIATQSDSPVLLDGIKTEAVSIFK